jgi:hypothetical protein
VVADGLLLSSGFHSVSQKCDTFGGLVDGNSKNEPRCQAGSTGIRLMPHQQVSAESRGKLRGFGFWAVQAARDIPWIISHIDPGPGEETAPHPSAKKKQDGMMKRGIIDQPQVQCQGDFRPAGEILDALETIPGAMSFIGFP